MTIKWRGGQVTRIEALTDAVFGFAITFLFVSFDVPRDFDALVSQLKGFVPFAACFALLIMVWVYHYRLFGRFDLDDGITMLLNSILLFVVLSYIYPLKFVFTAWLGDGSTTFSNWDQIRRMMSLYAAGFIAVFVVFGLMYHHAYRMRAALELNEDDEFFAVQGMTECGVMVAVGVVSMIVAETTPLRIAAPASGFAYASLGPLQYLRWRVFVKYRERILQRVLA